MNNNNLIHDFEITYNKIRSIKKDKNLSFFESNINKNQKYCFLMSPAYCDIYIKTNIKHDNISISLNNIYITDNIYLKTSIQNNLYTNIKKENRFRLLKSNVLIITFLKDFKETYFLKIYVHKKDLYDNIHIYCIENAYNSLKGRNLTELTLTNKYELHNIFFIIFKNKITKKLDKMYFPIYLNGKKSEYSVGMKFYKITDQKYYMYVNDILNFKNIYDECEYCKKNNNTNLNGNDLLTIIFSICKCKLRKMLKEYIKIGLDKSITIIVKDSLSEEYTSLEPVIFTFSDLQIITDNYKKNKSLNSNNLINDVNLLDIYKFYE